MHKVSVCKRSLTPTVSVDTFFLMSGLLVSFLLLRKLDRNKGKFNVGLFYLHRYLRLTPVYVVILGFVATLMVYVGIGPNWYSGTFYSDACHHWDDWLIVSISDPLRLSERILLRRAEAVLLHNVWTVYQHLFRCPRHLFRTGICGGGNSWSFFPEFREAYLCF